MAADPHDAAGDRPAHLVERLGRVALHWTAQAQQHRRVCVPRRSAPLTRKDPGDAINWVSQSPHDAFRTINAPFMAAYRAGATSPTPYITSESIVYWYRPRPRNVPCPLDPLGPPYAYTWAADSVFAATILTSPATLTITSGRMKASRLMQPGIQWLSVPMGAGYPSFSLRRGSEVRLHSVRSADAPRSSHPASARAPSPSASAPASTISTSVAHSAC